MYCSMQGCGLTRQNCRKSNINMFLFPSIPKQRRAWLASCQVQGELRKDAFVCALHFDVSDVMRLGNAHPKCNPTQQESWLGKFQLRGERTKDGLVCAVHFGEKEIELECNGTAPSQTEFFTRSTAPKCRSCLNTDSTEFVDMLTATSDGMNLYDYFNECTQLGATIDDELPGTLCLNCSCDLNTTYNFLQQARQSEAILRVIATSKNPMDTIGSQSELAAADSDGTDEPNAEVVDPLGGIEGSVEQKPNMIKPNIKSDNDAEINFEAQQQLFAIKLEIVGNTVELGGNSAELSCTESQIENETENEDMDLDWWATTNNHDASEIKRKSKTKYLPCQFCQTEFPNVDELRKHLIVEHKSQVTCQKCPKIYNFPHELEVHIELVHGENSPVQCRYCPDPTPSIPRNELAKHFRLKHNHRYSKYFPKSKRSQRVHFQCSICMRNFSTAVLLSDHMHLHTNDKPYKCRFCPMDFNMKRSFQAHLKRKHDATGCIDAFQRELEGSAKTESAPIKYFARSRQNEIEFPTQFRCEICERSFPSAALRQNHLKSHAADEFYQCDHCPMRFSVERSYQAHLRREHGVGASLDVDGEAAELEDNMELIQCAECNKKLPPLPYKTHKAWHERKKKMKAFLCSYCPRLFNNEVVLKTHERKIHLNERPATKECHICKKRFELNYLSKHVQKVHVTERNFACGICGNAFKSQTQLNTHSKLHQERSFECSVCHKKFIRRYDLKVHMRSHTGEQPYSCQICDKRFSMRGRLTYHLQKHAGVKHRCDECGKEFNQRMMLRKHLYKHTGMPYRCPSCGYSCVVREVFRRHLRAMHASAMTEQQLLEMFKENTGRMPRIPNIEQLTSAAQDTIF